MVLALYSGQSINANCLTSIVTLSQLRSILIIHDLAFKKFINILQSSTSLFHPQTPACTIV